MERGRASPGFQAAKNRKTMRDGESFVIKVVADLTNCARKFGTAGA